MEALSLEESRSLATFNGFLAAGTLLIEPFFYLSYLLYFFLIISFLIYFTNCVNPM